MNKNHIILICAVSLLFLLLWLLLYRRKQRKLEIKRNIDDKLREEALDKVLIGGGNKLRAEKGSPVPYDVKYDSDQRKKKSRGGKQKNFGGSVMIQLTELSELSTRKYIFNVVSKISFGSYTQNDIVINAGQIAGRQCEILRVGKKLYLKNLASSGNLTLKRGRRQFNLTQDAVLLQSGDVLQIENYIYEIVFYK